MTQDRVPRPMSADKLKTYRWTTALQYPAPITLAGDTPLTMDIAVTTHRFADGHSPSTPDLPGPIEVDIWGYGQQGQQITYPGPPLVATRGTAAQISFVNKLPVTHLYPYCEPPYDHAAAAMGLGAMGRYDPGHCVVHLHGAELPWEFDGHPVRIPTGADNPHGYPTIFRPGQTVTYQYPNNQRGGGMLWYHDHTMDSTARNVYAGLAGGYLLRAPTEQQAIDAGQLPPSNYELALVLQDRSFTDNRELLYGDAKYLGDYWAIRDQATTRTEIRNGLAGIDPPMTEFKGHALVVNGTLWPTLAVEPRPYRLRLLNGANSRYFVLRFSKEMAGAPANDWERTGDRVADGPVTMYQIGSDCGIFAAAVGLSGAGAPDPANYLVLAPGERADVLVDFSTVASQSLFLTNHSTEQSPLGISGDNLDRFDQDGLLLRDVMRFDVAAVANLDRIGPSHIEEHSGNPTIAYYGSVTAHGASDPPQITALNDLLAGVVKAEDEAYAARFGKTADELSLATITSRAGAQGIPLPPIRVRDFVFKEFADVPEAKSHKTGGDWVPGRRGWSAITIQSDPTKGQTPGFLWGDDIARWNVDPIIQSIVGPPPMGGPALDGARDWHGSETYVEMWNLWNLSGDTHPIHLHLVNFMVLERLHLGTATNPYDGLNDLTDLSVLTGAMPVLPNENSGWKDTVRMQPGELLRILVQFNGNGGGQDPIASFVWHCHLLEHEDMGMMRPLLVADERNVK